MGQDRLHSSGASKRLGPVAASALIAGMAFLSCLSPGSAHAPRIAVDPPDIDVLAADARQGRAGTKDRAVYIFSQGNVGDEDPQVYGFPGAVIVRGWAKWDRAGLSAADYNVSYLKKAQAEGILFVGGGTGSALFRDEAGAAFEDWATRDARGALVPHSGVATTMYRASLANPDYWDYVLGYCELQIDANVDGIFIDEANAGYQGGGAWNHAGNEGYDDYFLAGFNAYLAAKHPDFEAADWLRVYGMPADNRIVKGEKPGDFERNFDYRAYLSSTGWDRWPEDPANPLAPLYGKVVGNRMDPAGDSCRERILLYRWSEFVAKLRDYARMARGKEIVVTSNGLFPFVDFNCMGLYEGNRDDDGAEIAWIPLKRGRLDGTVSLKAAYRKVLARSRAISGDVPLVLFIDWPTRLMDSYYAFSLAEKKDFWRIYAAEAYACGLRYAFHLKTSLYGDPTARESGVLGFLEEYAKFYADHADLYTELSPTDIEAVAPPQMTATVSGDGKRYCLHLVNHRYKRGLVAQGPFSVSFPLPIVPQRAILHSPDSTASRPVAFRAQDGLVTVDIDRLVSYDCVELR
jgi:hypothetical protein